jgi:hypothetical protein
VVAAARTPRSLAGLAARYRALDAAAARLGAPSARSLVDAIHGPPPPWPTIEDGASDRALPPATVPDGPALVARLAAVHGLDTTGVELRAGAASWTVTVAPGHAHATVGPSGDALAAVALTLHEAGHALYRAQQAGMASLLAAPPARWFDEAIAAWAVCALEDPTLVADPDVRAAARRRRHRRELITARLAGFEALVLAGAEVATAWPSDLVPAAYPALFDEPGLMASYAAADSVRLAPRAGELRAWARAGAALELTPFIKATVP